jgi:hypothetical protein
MRQQRGKNALDSARVESGLVYGVGNHVAEAGGMIVEGSCRELL